MHSSTNHERFGGTSTGDLWYNVDDERFAALKAAVPEPTGRGWITETGCRLHQAGSRRKMTDEDAAKSLIKQYVMACTRHSNGAVVSKLLIPRGEDAGFGLLACRRFARERSRYQAFQSLSKVELNRAADHRAGCRWEEQSASPDL